ncbi:MAG: hypothetical protein NVSMB2_24980 [Chloroflexota bacterium]
MTTTTSLFRRALGGAATITCAGLLLGGSVSAAAGDKVAVYGEELTPGQRQEIESQFGPDAASAKQVNVSHADLVNALSGAGLPVDPEYMATSSSLLTCLNKGDGLTVKTQNITRIPAAAYANALVTAGIGDGNVLIAGPASYPLTGETAMVGAMKAFPQCQGSAQPDAKRVNLAYQQLARTSDLAGDSDDLTAASTVMLKASQPVVTGQAKDDAAVTAALDKAAADEGLTVPADAKPQIVGFLKSLNGLDYGTYAKGYIVQQLSPTEAKVVAAGAGAPAQSQNQAQPQTAAAGAAFTGDVQQVSDPMVVRTDGKDRAVAIPAGVLVTRDGNAAALNDIQPGDRVSVAQAPDGTTQRIDATSQRAANNDALKWLPLLLIPLLLGVLWAIARRRRDAFVLERTPSGAVRRTSRTGGR